jgi:hypothetical protein
MVIENKESRVHMPPKNKQKVPNHNTQKNKKKNTETIISSKIPISTAGFCSPNRTSTYNKTQTCLTLPELQMIGIVYNQKRPEDLIPHKDFKSVAHITLALQKRFQNCKDEACWIEQEPIQEIKHSLASNYRPSMPSEWKTNTRLWLNTQDIEKVMQQYKDESFKFLGVFPVDFNQKISGTCISRNMCNFNATDLITDGTTQFGIIFNLDKHDKPGSHWVACYCNMDPRFSKYGICYYDSGGVEPPKYIRDFIKLVRDQVSKHWESKSHSQYQTSKIFVVKYNDKVHQNKNTECGIFSMLFNILCKEYPNETYRKTRNRIPVHKNDDFVHQLRYILYRPYP